MSLRRFQLRPRPFAAAIALLAVCAPAAASNDLNIVGFGIQSLGLAGTDLAITSTTEAVNINPAGLQNIGNARFDYYIGPYYYGQGGHGDDLNGKVSPDNIWGGLFGAGYAFRVNPRLVLGAGLYVQGGTGYQYKHLDTIFGTRDEYSAIFGVTKLDTGLSLKLTDTLTVGATLATAYSQARQKVFPDTSTPAFSGLRFDGGEGFSNSGRFGLQYKPSPDFTIGATYGSRTRLKLDDGTATLNYEAQGQGRVRYGRASIKGLNLAQEAGAGFAWRFQPRWTLVGEAMWLDWSDALKSTTLRASHPNNPNVPAEIRLTSPLDHRDQVVYSMGLAIDVSESSRVLMGYNHARNAIPGSTLTPAFNLTENNEVDLGYVFQPDEHWEIGTDFQDQFPKSVRYTNPDQPFGSGTEETFQIYAWYVEITRRW